MATALPGINSAPAPAARATQRPASSGSANEGSGLLPTLASPRSPSAAVSSPTRTTQESAPPLAVAARAEVQERAANADTKEAEAEAEAPAAAHTTPRPTVSEPAFEGKDDADVQLTPVAGSVCSTDSKADAGEQQRAASYARSVDMARSEDGMAPADVSGAQQAPEPADDDVYSDDEFEQDTGAAAAVSQREAQPRASVASSGSINSINSTVEAKAQVEADAEAEVEVEEVEVVSAHDEPQHKQQAVHQRITTTVTHTTHASLSPRPPPARRQDAHSRSAPTSRATSVTSAESRQSGSVGRTQLYGNGRSPRTNGRKLRVVRHSPRSPRSPRSSEGSGSYYSAPAASGQPSLSNQVAFGSMYRLTPAPGPGAYDTTRTDTATAISPRAPKYSMAVRTKAVAQDRFILRAEALSRQVPGPGAHNVARSSFGTQSLCKTTIPWSKVSVSRIEASGGNAPTYSFGKRETGRLPGGLSPRSDEAARARASPLLGSSAMMAKKNYGVHSPGPGSFHIKSTVGTGGRVGSLAAAPRSPRTHRFSRAPRF